MIFDQGLVYTTEVKSLDANWVRLIDPNHAAVKKNIAILAEAEFSLENLLKCNGHSVKC